MVLFSLITPPHLHLLRPTCTSSESKQSELLSPRISEMRSHEQKTIKDGLKNCEKIN